MLRNTAFLFLVLSMFASTPQAGAADIPVAPGGDIQAAIDSANPGDVILLEAGEYVGDIDFGGKNVTVLGTGFDTVLRGSGTNSVVRFSGGEGPTATLDSVQVTGGLAVEGGGIYIHDASPTILRSYIVGNRSSRFGSGIYSGGATADPLISNNLIAYNTRTSSDPHGIQVNGGAPVIVNNTIVRSDSNGIFITGGAEAVVMNNIIARNGSRGSEIGRRGRGICNFTTGSVILYNDFWKNSKSALLQSGRDFRRVRGAERSLDLASLAGNTDRTPRFVRRRLAATADDASASDFDLRSNSRMINAGDPDAAFFNPDGSRNTIGHLGGALAAN